MIELNASFWMVLRLMDVKLMQEKNMGLAKSPTLS